MVKVEGESGWPELVPGARYLATSFGTPKIGQFIVFSDPRNQDRILVKKIIAREADSFQVASSVSWGSSSEELGIIPHSLVLGRILMRVR